MMIISFLVWLAGGVFLVFKLRTENITKSCAERIPAPMAVLVGAAWPLVLVIFVFDSLWDLFFFWWNGRV